MTDVLVVPAPSGGDVLVIPAEGAMAGPPGGAGAAGAPGGNIMALPIAILLATVPLAGAVGTDMFQVAGYHEVGDAGAGLKYRRMAAPEAVEPGEKLSSDGVRLGLVRFQDIPLEAFGGVPNDMSAPARVANDAAVDAANAFDAQAQGTYYGTVHSLSFSAPVYAFGDLDGHDFKLTRRWKGAESGAAIAGGILRTQLIVPPGCKFLRVNGYNTIGDTVEGTPTTGADGSMFVDLHFLGNNGVNPDPASPNTEGYAIHPRAAIACFNCAFELHWDGILNNAGAGTGGATEGQASHCAYILCSFQKNFNMGLNDANAPDNNVTYVSHCNFIANGRCGWYAGEFLGADMDGACHFRDNGCRTDYFPWSSQCSYGGQWYYVNQTATMATTDAALRVGNPTTNSLWSKSNITGGPHINAPDFATFTGIFQKGGPVVADRSPNSRITAKGYYGEGAEPPFMWNNISAIIPSNSTNLDVGFGTAIIDGTLFQSDNEPTFNKLKQTEIVSTNAARTFAVHNTSATGGYGLWTTLQIEQGLESDGVTARSIGRIRASASSPLSASNGYMELGIRDGGPTEKTLLQLASGPYRFGPLTDNEVQLGAAGERLKEIFSANATINTSDEREKAYIQTLRDKLLDVADEIEWREFKFKDAVAAKGKAKARWHFGVIAQQVIEVCERHGIDGFELGLLCHDKWDDLYHPRTEAVPTFKIEKRLIPNKGKKGKPGKGFKTKYENVQTGTIEQPVLDKEGKPVMDLVRKAGERFGLRYDHLFSLKFAAQDRRYERLEARVANIEAVTKPLA